MTLDKQYLIRKCSFKAFQCEFLVAGKSASAHSWKVLTSTKSNSHCPLQYFVIALTLEDELWKIANTNVDAETLSKQYVIRPRDEVKLLMPNVLYKLNFANGFSSRPAMRSMGAYSTPYGARCMYVCQRSFVPLSNMRRAKRLTVFLSACVLQSLVQRNNITHFPLQLCSGGFVSYGTTFNVVLSYESALPALNAKFRWHRWNCKIWVASSFARVLVVPHLLRTETYLLCHSNL